MVEPVTTVSHGLEEEEDFKVSVAKGVSYSDLPKTSKRAVTQSKVMNDLSPNVAAAALGLSKPTFPNWEWLHLVAFSIRPTHVSELSQKSKLQVKKHHQVQQIAENLVLGTAAANTEMLNFESSIKEMLKAHRDYKLELAAMPLIENQEVEIDDDDYTVPLCKVMRYDFFFYNDTKETVGPFVVTFDCLSHTKPASASFREVYEGVERAFAAPVKLKNLPGGIRTDSMEEL